MATYVRPIKNIKAHPISAAYRKPGNWAAGYHPGVDIACPVGTPVYATIGGDVRTADRRKHNLWGSAFGTHIIVNDDRDGSDWAYCHLSRVLVKEGQKVATGQLIGYSGNTGRTTGPHLHLERRPRRGGYGSDRNPNLWPNSGPGSDGPLTAVQKAVQAVTGKAKSSGIKVYISPSTQTGNAYATRGTNEAAQMRRLRDALVPMLKAAGHDVRATRNLANDIRTPVREANAWGADRYVSLHTNATGLRNSTRRGTEVYILAKGGKAEGLARHVYDRLVKVVPAPGRGVLTSRFYEIRATKAPAILIEADYHDSREGSEWVQDHIGSLAAAIARGVCDDIGGSAALEAHLNNKTTKTAGGTAAATTATGRDVLDMDEQTLRKIIREETLGARYRNFYRTNGEREFSTVSGTLYRLGSDVKDALNRLGRIEKAIGKEDKK